MGNIRAYEYGASIEFDLMTALFRVIGFERTRQPAMLRRRYITCCTVGFAPIIAGIVWIGVYLRPRFSAALVLIEFVSTMTLTLLNVAPLVPTTLIALDLLRSTSAAAPARDN